VDARKQTSRVYKFEFCMTYVIPVCYAARNEYSFQYLNSRHLLHANKHCCARSCSDGYRGCYILYGERYAEATLTAGRLALPARVGEGSALEATAGAPGMFLLDDKGAVLEGRKGLR
jgi:hypothetical protein